jgi:hypothetical protein
MGYRLTMFNIFTGLSGFIYIYMIICLTHFRSPFTFVCSWFRFAFLQSKYNLFFIYFLLLLFSKHSLSDL